MRHALGVVLVLCVLAIASSSAAQSLPQLFSEGNAAFFRGDHETAIARYEALVDAGVDDPDVYYNLGTAYARVGRCGFAIVALQRSLRLSAGDDAAEANLRACQTLLGKRRAQRDGEATVQTRPPWTDAVLSGVSESVLASLVWGFNFVLFVALLIRRWVRHETVRLSLAVSGWLLGLALTLAIGAFAIKVEWFRDGQGAIVLREGAALREGPDPRAKARAEAYEGEPARLLQQEGEFVRVRLTRGAEGWMDRADVGALSLRD